MFHLLLAFAMLGSHFASGTARADDSSDLRFPVPRYGTAEVVLHASQFFDGNTGTPNPFTDVTLTLHVTSPTGLDYEVDGFFDGDGAGGAIGDVFKGRIYADEPGTWTWTSTSSDSGLDGAAGSFLCDGPLGGAFGRGALVVDPLHPRFFMHADGTPVYSVAKYLDNAIGGLRTKTHPLLSEFWTETDRRDLLDRQLALRTRRIDVYIANKLDYEDFGSTTPWVGTWDVNDKTRFDLSRWAYYDQWIRTMRDEGFAADLWMFADESDFGNLPDADRQLLIRYTMARLSAYAHTLFTLVSEWQEGWTQAEVNLHANYLQAHNPWKRLVTVHGQKGDFAFPTQPWATIMSIQSGNFDDYPFIHGLGLSTRALAVKPVLNEEYWNGNETTKGRQKAWAAFTAGAGGSGNGAFLSHLVSFTDKVPFHEMVPLDSLVVSSNAYALAKQPTDYVFYLHSGGTIDVDLGQATGLLETRWYNPVTGAFSDGVDVQGGATRSFTPPGTGDWVLNLRSCTAAGPAGPVSGVGIDKAKQTISWTAQARADSYDVVKGDVYALFDSGGDYSSTLIACLGNDLAAGEVTDPAVPVPGGGFYYLVRVARVCGGGGPGTYDSAGPGQVGSRDAEIAASTVECP